MPTSAATRSSGVTPAKRGNPPHYVAERAAGSADVESRPAQMQRSAGRVSQKGGTGSTAPAPRQGKAAVIDGNAVLQLIDVMKDMGSRHGGGNAEAVPERAAAPQSSETEAVAEEAAAPVISESGVTQMVKAVEEVGGLANISRPLELAPAVEEEEEAAE